MWIFSVICSGVSLCCNKSLRLIFWASESVIVPELVFIIWSSRPGRFIIMMQCFSLGRFDWVKSLPFRYESF